MNRSVLLTALGLFTIAVSSAASANTTSKIYAKDTSAPNGKATCAFVMEVEGAAGQQVTFTLLPGGEDAETGENGGEIRLRAPLTAPSIGNEVACEAYPDTTATGTLAIRRNLEAHPVIFQVHSHPNDDCGASGNANGRIRMSVPTGTITTRRLSCVNSETLSAMHMESLQRSAAAVTASRTRTRMKVRNHGPGTATGATFNTTMPQNRVFVESATFNGDPCTVGTLPGTPIMHKIVCDIGDMPPDASGVFDMTTIPRRTGGFDTVFTVGADNNSTLIDPTLTGRTTVAQGVNHTLALTVKGRNGGGGTVNVNPPDPATPAACTHPVPGDPSIKKTVCLHIYAQGTMVTLTAKPQAGSNVTWSGACTGTALTCTLTMDSGKSVEARFEP